MALFEYTELLENGKQKVGVIDADTLLAAKAKLRQMRVIVTKITLAKTKRRNFFSKTLLINFTREVMQLLSSGLPLYESLLTIEEKYKNHKAHAIFLDLCDKVKGGCRFSKALACHGTIFDQLYVSMVEAGENTGRLDKAFLQLYRVLARTEKFKRQIRAAMLYPLFLASFCGVVLVGLFLFLIPSMKELFEGRSLHPMTRVVLAISDAMNAHAFWFFPSLFILVLCISWFIRQEKTRKHLQAFFVHVPLLKRMIMEAVLMRFFRVLSVLLESGVPISKALRLSRGVMNNPVYEKVVFETEEGIITGKKLSYLFRQSPLMPPLVVRMLATAEETGSLSEMMMNIAEIYEEMFERSISQFTNLLQPVMLLILGLMVGTVLLAVLLPMTDVSAIT